MKNANLILLFIIIVSASFSNLQAQEQQVALDREGRLFSIDQTLDLKLKLFTHYPDFLEAKLYQVNDTSFLLEVLSKVSNQTIRSREMMTNIQAEELRQQVSERLALHAPRALLNQDGRSQLLVISSIISFGYYGPSIPIILNSFGTSTAGLYLLTAGTGFFLPFAMTKNRDVTIAQSQLTTYGQTRGILYGILFLRMFDNEVDYRASLGMGLATSVISAFAGYGWATRSGMTADRVATIGAYGDLGMLIGVGTGFTLGIAEGSYPSRLTAFSLLSGAAGGIMMGNYLGKKDYYTQGDAIVAAGSASLGAYIPMSLLSLIEPDDYRWYSAFGTAGMVGGLLYGDRLAKKHDFSTRQSILIVLSQSAGGLIGAGLGYLIPGPTNDIHDIKTKTLAIMTGLGALAGFGLTTHSFIKEENREPSGLTLQLNINPLGLLNASGLAGKSMPGQPVPTLMGSLRF